MEKETMKISINIPSAVIPGVVLLVVIIIIVK